MLISYNDIHLFTHTPRKFLYLIMSNIKKNENLNENQTHALMIISDKKEINMRQLSNLIGISKGSFTQVIDKLVNKNLVQRIQRPEDRRTIYLILTNSGEETAKQLKKHAHEEINRIFENLSLENIENLINALQIIKQYTELLEE